MPIKADQLREKEDYQKLIMERLHEDNDFRIRPNTAYKPGLAMDTEMLLEFLEDTQHDEMEHLRRMYKDRTEETVINYINAEINKESRGLIDVIKHGVEFDNGATLKLMYRKPDSTINTQAVANYKKNIFSVMEEVYHKADERVDLVLFLNGLAIFAIELKCNTSGQTYKDAIKQYKEERDATTRLFKTKVGVFAAFAMDLNEAYFTTELKGADTFFNPFNIGENFGKGNPHNEDGLNVSYMWENIWTKDKILFLIERFIYIKKKETRNADTGKIKKSKVLIFPRFHQLRAVERVMNDVIINHTSCNYLIEHSAGSGKTETISWLAHKLFVPLTTKVTQESKESTDIDKLDSAPLHLERTIKNIGKVEANGMQTADGFVVFKGSLVSLQDDDTIPAVIKERRKSAPLDKQGILQEDMLFTSPSYAAMFVIGKSANGLTSWKTTDGKTLKSLENEN